MKQVYTFGNGQAEGRADMKNLLGGKGANLAEMNLIGVPVPPGFTNGHKIWRRRKSAVSLCSFGSTCLNAGYDGHRS